MNQGRDNFLQVMRSIEARLPTTDYTLWLKDLLFVEYTEGILILSTDSLIRKERIDQRYIDFITKICLEHFSDFKQVRIEWKKQAKAPSHPATSPQNPEKNRTPSTLDASSHDGVLPASSRTSVDVAGAEAKTPLAPPRLTKPTSTGSSANPSMGASLRGVLAEHIFERFLVLKENELVYNFARKAVHQFGRNSPLYFYGPVGVGKTHLLQSVANEVRKLFPFYKIRYVTPDKFIQEFVASIYEKKDREFRQRYQTTDLLIIDDVQFFGGKQKSTIEFFHIFNAIYAPGKQMIFASDCPPAELDGLDVRLKSRLSASVIVSIPEPSMESRLRLLSFFAQQKEITLSEDVLTLLAKRLPSNVRELKGAIATLKETLIIYGEQKRSVEPNEAFCKELLKDRFARFGGDATDEANTRIYSVEAILKEICRLGEISLKELRSTKKTQHLAEMRKVASYMLKKHTHLSISEIGDYLGGKTPSAISYNLKEVEKKLPADPGIRQFCTKFEEQIFQLSPA